MGSHPGRASGNSISVPVIELCALRLAGMYGSLQAPRTVAEVAGMALVAVHDSDSNPAMVRQRFVALQPVIDVVSSLPQPFSVHESIHPPEAVGAAHGLPEPVAEETGVGGEFQSIETAHTGPEQSRYRFDDGSAGDTRVRAPVHNVGDDSSGKLEDFLRISDQATENG
jgi:hypothetical protein